MNLERVNGTKAFMKHLITELMSNIGQVWTYHCK